MVGGSPSALQSQGSVALKIAARRVLDSHEPSAAAETYLSYPQGSWVIFFVLVLLSSSMSLQRAGQKMASGCSSRSFGFVNKISPHLMVEHLIFPIIE